MADKWFDGVSFRLEFGYPGDHHNCVTVDDQRAHVHGQSKEGSMIRVEDDCRGPPLASQVGMNNHRPADIGLRWWVQSLERSLARKLMKYRLEVGCVCLEFVGGRAPVHARLFPQDVSNLDENLEDLCSGRRDDETSWDPSS